MVGLWAAVWLGNHDQVGEWLLTRPVLLHPIITIARQALACWIS
jgi:hypothetical protein